MSIKEKIKSFNLRKLNKYGILIVFMALFVACSIISPVFLRTTNLLNIARQVSIIGILSIGQTFVILSGGIDLSVGSIMAFSTLLAAGLKDHGPVVAFIVPILAGSLAGGINGIIITKGKIQPFIVTLGMMTALVGIGLTYSGGHPIIGSSQQLSFLGQGRIGLVPVQAIIFMLVAIFATITLKKTRLGRHIYALGGNEEACRLSGINVDKNKTYVYMISGLLAGFAGVIMATYLNVGEANLGRGMELDAIAAVVIGGTAFSGGIGGAPGTVVGVLIIGVLNNLLNLMNVPGYTQQIVKGVIIVGAVFLQSLQMRRAKD